MQLSNRLILLTLSLGIFVYPAQDNPKLPMHIHKLHQSSAKTPKHQYQHQKPRGNNKPQVRIRAPHFQT